MNFKPRGGEAMKDLTSLQERMNRIFSETVRRIREIGEPDDDKAWSPAVDVYEGPEAFVLLADVPGVPKDRISVEVLGGSLIVKGERLEPPESLAGSRQMSERHYGPFERAFNLPVNVSPEGITARVTDGVLTVTIDKSRQDAVRIPVAVD